MEAITAKIKSYYLNREKEVRKFFIILFTVGFLGIAVPVTREFFIILTPFILIISFLALLIFHSPVSGKKQIAIFAVVYLASFLIEAAGVKTGIIFGEYSYGNGLGIKVLDTPLIIGINWVMLVYCTGVIVDNLHSWNILKILSASLMMVFYDIVLEQVAPAMDMWKFSSGPATFRNYMVWLIVSILLHSLVRLSGIKSVNRLAAPIFIIHLLFFCALTIFFKIAE